MCTFLAYLQRDEEFFEGENFRLNPVFHELKKTRSATMPMLASLPRLCVRSKSTGNAVGVSRGVTKWGGFGGVRWDRT